MNLNDNITNIGLSRQKGLGTLLVKKIYIKKGKKLTQIKMFFFPLFVYCSCFLEIYPMFTMLTYILLDNLTGP